MISIVIPVFNERDSLPLLHEEIVRAAPQSALTVEIIFVDDGSTDGSWTAITELAREHPWVHDRLVDQTRQHLVAGGYLILEIGAPQESQARQRLAAFAEYHVEPTIRDFSGHPRVLVARRLDR